MMEFSFMQLLPLLPQLSLFASTLLLLLLGLYGDKETQRAVPKLAPFVLLAIFWLVTQLKIEEPLLLFGGMLRLDGFVLFAQGLVLLGGALSMFLAWGWLAQVQEERFEFAIVLLLSVLGMTLMIAANDLLAIYLGLELTSLALYVLAAFRRDSLKATEAGIKYFVLGSLASGILLFGMSLVYGFSGTIGFTGLAQWVQGAAAAGTVLTAAQTGVLVGLVLMIIGFCFKVSAVPFHMWTPDVYEGVPTPVTAFFAIAPKIAALALFARLLMQPFGDWLAQWQQILAVVAGGSMLVGAFAALVQKNIKRMLAYSSIGHVGYVLMGLAAGTPEGMQGLLVYLSIYLVMSVGVFACVLLMQRGGEYVEEISALAGLSRRQPWLAAAIAIFMFSLAGIPPLAGFFGKWYVFLAALEAGLVTLAVVGVLSSVVAAYYYLRVVKVMYFDEEDEALTPRIAPGMRLLLAGCSGLVLLFILLPAPLLEAAKTAAKALWL